MPAALPSPRGRPILTCGGEKGVALILGVIGYGTIATLALQSLPRALQRPLDQVICLARPTGLERAQSMLASCDGLAQHCSVVTEPGAFAKLAPDLVIEAAGHAALTNFAADLLRAGCDFIVTSVGALSDATLEAELREASQQGGRLIFCAGAIGGLDILQAAKLSGLERVTYRSRKPPAAWKGTPAQERIALDALRQATCFYEGTARGAARDFPQNANVAATLALFGAGFDATQVQLIADPQISGNIHEVEIASACVNVTLRIEGKPSPDNPKTSLTTAYSLAADILRWMDTRTR